MLSSMKATICSKYINIFTHKIYRNVWNCKHYLLCNDNKSFYHLKLRKRTQVSNKKSLSFRMNSILKSVFTLHRRICEFLSILDCQILIFISLAVSHQLTLGVNYIWITYHKKVYHLYTYICMIVTEELC
jgi:hypothetical protein